MFKLFVPLLCAALAFTTPTTAKAGLSDDEVGAIVFGLFTGLIINEMSKDNKKDNTTHYPKNRGSVHAPGQSSGHGWSPHYPRPVPTPQYTTRLPDHCKTAVRTSHGFYELYRGSCLDNNFVKTPPSYCKVRIPSQRGMMEGYDADCLYDKGYRPERWR